MCGGGVLLVRRGGWWWWWCVVWCGVLYFVRFVVLCGVFCVFDVFCVWWCVVVLWLVCVCVCVCANVWFVDGAENRLCRQDIDAAVAEWTALHAIQKEKCSEGFQNPEKNKVGS